MRCTTARSSSRWGRCFAPAREPKLTRARPAGCRNGLRLRVGRTTDLRMHRARHQPRPTTLENPDPAADRRRSCARSRALDFGIALAFGAAGCAKGAKPGWRRAEPIHLRKLPLVLERLISASRRAAGVDIAALVEEAARCNDVRRVAHGAPAVERRHRGDLPQLLAGCAAGLAGHRSRNVCCDVPRLAGAARRSGADAEGHEREVIDRAHGDEVRAPASVFGPRRASGGASCPG